MDAPGGLADDRFTDLGIPVTERSDTEATGQVEIARRPSPSTTRHPRLRPTSLGVATVTTRQKATDRRLCDVAVAIAGFSCRRRIEYSYQWRPNGT